MPNQQPNSEEQFNQASQLTISSSKPKFNLKYILIILTLVILVGGGVFAYTRYINKQITSINQISVIKESEIVSCGTGLVYKPCEAGYYCEISSDCGKNCKGVCKKAELMGVLNWQTYQNTKYGFEVKYPPQWKLGDSIERIVQFYPDQDLIPPEIIAKREEADLGFTREWPVFTIQLFDNPDNLSLREYFNAYLLPTLDIEIIRDIMKTQEVIQEVKVNNIDAITFILVPNNLRAYIVSNKSKIIGIYFPSDEESVRGVTTSQTFYQILSTFKFIE